MFVAGFPLGVIDTSVLKRIPYSFAVIDIIYLRASTILEVSSE